MTKKFGFFWILIACLFSNYLKANNLQKADSLFTQKKYTEAFEIYDALYQSDKASPAMLLKMAYIKEGLGDYVSAIIYLSNYKAITGDRDADQKIRDLAEEYQLSGYDYTDTSYLLDLLRDKKILISGVLLSLIFLSLAIIYRNKKKERPLIPAFIFQIFLLIGLFYISNDLYYTQKAIITFNDSILMSGPSAGAEPIDVIRRGHKVNVMSEGKVWTQIEWNGQNVYIRSSKLDII